MNKEKIMQWLSAQDNDRKNLFLEKIIFCQFADELSFENYFKIKELEEAELFNLISFLYHQDCFLMMLEIMNNYKERFVSYKEINLNKSDISEQLISRLKRIEDFL